MLLAWLILTFIQDISAYYCEWGLCENGQYCCGDNQCCEYVYSLWYFWVGIVFIVLLLSACGGLFRYCYYNQSQVVIHRITSYVPVPNFGSSDESENFRVHDTENPHTYPPSYMPSNQGPPPPYMTSVNSHTSSGLK